MSASLRLAVAWLAAPTVCTPGYEGIPDSPVGSLLCGTWATRAPRLVEQLTRGHWPLLVAAAAALVALRVAWLLLRHRVWRAHARRGRWLEIVPPVTATPAATVGLWRLLATLLPAPRPLALRPARVVWEVQATAYGMRCGLWLPPGLNPTAVVRVLQRAWPGARADHTAPPGVTPVGAVAGLAVTSSRPEWQPIVDEPARDRERHDAYALEETDRLRAVYDGLAAAGRTGSGLLQVHVSRAPRHRVTQLRHAAARPEHARRTRGVARLVGLAVDGLRALITATLDLFTPGPVARRSRPRSDPYTAEMARQARAKLADAPHLLVAIRATATGPTGAAARAAADDITSGFGLLSPYFTRRRLHRPAGRVVRRWVPAGRMILASVTEVAALAGLPAQPATYGLPGAASRRRAPGRDVFTAGPDDAPATPLHRSPAADPSTARSTP